jgi:hypothetical protein
MNLESMVKSAFILIAVGGVTAGCGDSIGAQSAQPGRIGHEEGPAAAQTDAGKLYAMVKQARADLRDMRKQAGLHIHAAGPHIDPEGHHAGESEADRKRERGEREGHEDGRHEHREGVERSERSEGGHREGGEKGHREESTNRFSKLQKHDVKYRNGARLVLQYNPTTQAFVGRVQNTTNRTLPQVRVEIHLSNGVELGPTKRIDLKAGKSIPIELSALDQKFTHWVTHPEAGNEEAHGPGEEENEGHSGREARGEHSRREGGGSVERREHGDRERGERRGEGGERGHGEGNESAGNRPGAASLRPVYNQLQLLRGEMRAFNADLKSKKKG